MRLLTIDSSVFVSAARPNEIGNDESTGFLAWVRNTRPRLFLPTLVMAEVAAALSRTGSKPGLAQQYAMAVGQLPNTVMVVLDGGLARQAAAFGAQHKLRGADAVYLALAALFAVELVTLTFATIGVTLDREQLERGATILQTLTPADFLATIT
jgi:predicted nucleic acid-binding protein